MIKLHPCPFCGDDNVAIDDLDEVFRAVECPCGARGPVTGSDDESEEQRRLGAAAAWNAALRPAADLASRKARP